MRGFDNTEVRATLERVAADYRVLQLQNASLQQQLASLEAVLQAYQNAHAGAGAAVTDSRALQRANSEARAILMGAYAQAEETMARVTALTKEAEHAAGTLEHDPKNFQILLTSTVSELMTILKAAEQNPYDFATPPAPAPPLLLEASAARPNPAALDAEPVAKAEPVRYVPFVPRVQEPAVHDVPAHDEPAAFVQYDSPFSLAQDTPIQVEEGLVRFDRLEPAPRRAQAPIDFAPRTQRRSLVAVDSPSDAPVPVDPMDAILKELDRAMVEIPTLRRE